MSDTAEKQSLQSDNFITRVRLISAKEKYDKTEFLRSLIRFYSDNKALITSEYRLSDGYRKMGKLNLLLAACDLDGLVFYEDYIALLDEKTAKTINDDYKNERS